MELHKIKDLVDTDVTQLKVDIRTRNADGSLRYNETISGYHPVVVNLKSVEIKHQKISHGDEHKSPWLYWTWKTATISGPEYMCGYSGIASNFDEYYLAVAGN